MTSLYLPKEKLTKYRLALSKLESHRIEEKILLFELAARNQFHNSDLVKRLIKETGLERLEKMSLDAFLELVEVEYKKLPEERIYFIAPKL